MSLIESVKLNGHDAWHYLKDILTKLPTWPNSRLQELLPHHWVPPLPQAAVLQINATLRSTWVGRTLTYLSEKVNV
jgi:hypothetical protein